MATHVSATAKCEGVHYLQERLWQLILLTAFPNTCSLFLDRPRDVIRSVARFQLRVHTLRCETVTWNPRSSPACDLCEAEDDVQDEQHVNFHCTTLMWFQSGKKKII